MKIAEALSISASNQLAKPKRQLPHPCL